MQDNHPEKSRILIIHNRYRQPGGEDVVAEAQSLLLTSRGHDVRIYEKSNGEINSYSLRQKARLFFETAHNSRMAREIERLTADFKPHAAYVHNTLPLISPSIYEPLNDAGVKVIQWLHNFRLVCPAGTLYRDNAPCSLCLEDKSFAPALEYKCWSKSRLATAALVRLLKRQRRLKTWRKRIDLFVALNAAQKNLLVEHAGLPPEKVVVQPNFHDASILASSRHVGVRAEFLFVGRLAPEKGIGTLLKALRMLPEFNVAIAGDGPLREAVQRACTRPEHVWLGALSRAEVIERMASARALVFTSEWAEGCPTVILEALSCGVPVIASSVAGAVELLKEGQTALFFPPGDADALAACMRQLNDQPRLAAQMSLNAFEVFAKHFTLEAGYQNLLAIHRHLGLTAV